MKVFEECFGLISQRIEERITKLNFSIKSKKKKIISIFIWEVHFKEREMVQKELSKNPIIIIKNLKRIFVVISKNFLMIRIVHHDSLSKKRPKVFWKRVRSQSNLTSHLDLEASFRFSYLTVESQLYSFLYYHWTCEKIERIFLVYCSLLYNPHQQPKQNFTIFGSKKIHMIILKICPKRVEKKNVYLLSK